jgi:hypothetical protein
MVVAGENGKKSKRAERRRRAQRKEKAGNFRLPAGKGT